jgi:hypothetical protein
MPASDGAGDIRVLAIKFPWSPLALSLSLRKQMGWSVCAGSEKRGGDRKRVLMSQQRVLANIRITD